VNKEIKQRVERKAVEVVEYGIERGEKEMRKRGKRKWRKREKRDAGSGVCGRERGEMRV